MLLGGEYRNELHHFRRWHSNAHEPEVDLLSVSGMPSSPFPRQEVTSGLRLHNVLLVREELSSGEEIIMK